jgi:long-subunit fatty acid transport protein
MHERTLGREAWCALVVVVFLIVWPGTARALTDEEIFLELGFNLNNPGARALGMGGTSFAVTNDAAVAVANPAGLWFLGHPQAFVEYRGVDQDPRVVASTSGSLEVDLLTGARDLPYLGVTSVSNPDPSNDLGFVLAWPLDLGSTKRRLTLAGSTQVVLSNQGTLSSGDDQTESRFSFDTYPNTVRNGQIEAYSVSTVTGGEGSMDIVYWSVGAALEVSDDFSFGLTLSYATMDVAANTETQVVDPQELVLDPSHPRLPTQPARDVYRTSIGDSDTGFAYTIGVDWHPNSIYASGSSPLRLGAVFKKGASFTFTETTFLNDISNTILQDQVVVPDRFGLGASYRVWKFWTFALDYERIEYSDLLDGFQTGINVLTSGRVALGSYTIDPDAEVTFSIDDGDLWRLGLEYARPLGASTNRQFAVWAGYYRTPDGRIRMTQFNATDPAVNAAYLGAFQGGEEEDHFTAGVGFDVGRSSIQLAGGFSDRSTTIVGSYSYTWKKK